jgi:hypothetical protein
MKIWWEDTKAAAASKAFLNILRKTFEMGSQYSFPKGIVSQPPRGVALG